MNKDTIFRDSDGRPQDFAFNQQVAEVFDDMLQRSIPFYSEQQDIFRKLARKFWRPGTSIYDLGCSTATTLIGMANDLPGARSLVGYDNSVAMLDRGRAKIAANNLQQRIELRLGDLAGELSDLPLDNASVVTMCWTLQFLRPMQRDRVVRWIRDALIDQGILIVAEKVLANNGDMNRLFIDCYYDFKKQNEYSESEIARKREALENVLVPYTLEENVDLFKRNGFEVVETVFQWCNFACYVCLKQT